MKKATKIDEKSLVQNYIRTDIPNLKDDIVYMNCIDNAYYFKWAKY